MTTKNNRDRNNTPYHSDSGDSTNELTSSNDEDCEVYPKRRHRDTKHKYKYIKTKHRKNKHETNEYNSSDDESSEEDDEELDESSEEDDEELDESSEEDDEGLDESSEEYDEELDESSDYYPRYKRDIKRQTKRTYESDGYDDDDDDELYESDITRKEVKELIAELFPSEYFKKKHSLRNNEDRCERSKGTGTKKVKKTHVNSKEKTNKKDRKDKKERKDKKNKKDKKDRKDRHNYNETESDDSEYILDDDDEELPMNFVFQIGGGQDEGSDNEYNDDDDDVDLNSDDEAMFMKENYITSDKKNNQKKS